MLDVFVELKFYYIHGDLYRYQTVISLDNATELTISGINKCVLPYAYSVAVVTMFVKTVVRRWISIGADPVMSIVRSTTRVFFTINIFVIIILRIHVILTRA